MAMACGERRARSRETFKEERNTGKLSRPQLGAPPPAVHPPGTPPLGPTPRWSHPGVEVVVAWVVDRRRRGGVDSAHGAGTGGGRGGRGVWAPGLGPRGGEKYRRRLGGGRGWGGPA